MRVVSNRRAKPTADPGSNAARLGYTAGGGGSGHQSGDILRREVPTMATKQMRPTEEARRGVQSGADKLANAVEVTVGPPEGDVARDKAFAALSVPKGGRTVRKMAVPARRYWPSANSQRAPSRPQGSKKSPK